MPRRVARRRHVASHCATARRLTRTTRVAGTLGCSAVRADVFMPGEHLQMASDRETDGGKAWKVQLDGNPMSFEGVYKANQPLDVGECTALAVSAHAALRAKQ